MCNKIVLFLFLHLFTIVSLIQGQDYNNEEILDSQGDYILRWKLLEDSESIEFEVEVATKGWVGFGVSPSGNMVGADIFMGGVFDNGTAYGDDRHALDTSLPIVDPSQDWTLLSGRETPENKTILRFSRRLNTCDKEHDYVIGNDTNRLIWAKGTSDVLSYHGVNRGTKSTNLIQSQAVPDDFDLSPFTNFTFSVNVTMPSIETSYWCTFHKGPMLNSKHHIVAFDTLLPTFEAYQHTHHFVVFYCKAPAGSNQTDEEIFDQYTHDKGVQGDHCHNNKELPVAMCQSPVLYTWAKGGKMMIFPEDVGFPIGNDDCAPSYYMIELHYDNPGLIEGSRFVTGLSMYYTSELRPIDAGIFALGQQVDISLTVPPNTDNFKVASHCPVECTQDLGPEGITVFASLLHSHKSGRKMRTRHFRGNVELPWLDFDDNYDFDFQQNKILFEPRVIHAGDQLTTECTYSSTWKNGEAVIGGYATAEEICQNLLWYYPLGGLSGMSNYDVDKHLADFGVTKHHTVDDFSGRSYIIEEPLHLAGDYYDMVSFKFNWTAEFKAEYAEERLNGLYYANCNGNRVGAKYPNNFIEYVPEDSCDVVPTDATSSTVPSSTSSSGSTETITMTTPGPSTGGPSSEITQTSTTAETTPPSSGRRSLLETTVLLVCMLSVYHRYC